MQDTDLRAALEQQHEDAYGWALSLCRYDRQEADAVLQTAYLRILDRSARFGARSTFRTWLFGVIRHCAADRRRRAWLRRLRLVSDDALVRVADTRAQPEQLALADERTARLRAAVRSLPRRQREVVQLVFYHQLSLAEAAGVTGVSFGTASRHYERAKRRLRKTFGPPEAP